jgi:SOS-response transcriptional repressor LexA
MSTATAKLTPHQLRVLEFIGRTIVETGDSPRFREIRAEFGLRSSGSVTSVLDALERKGAIRRIKPGRRVEVVAVAGGEDSILLRAPDRPRRRELTDAQRRLRDFIVAFRRENGYAPSLREMAAAMGLSHINGVSGHLNALLKKGAIRWRLHHNRTITVVDPDPGDGDRLRASHAELRACCELALAGGGLNKELAARLARALDAAAEGGAS